MADGNDKKQLTAKEEILAREAKKDDPGFWEEWGKPVTITAVGTGLGVGGVLAIGALIGKLLKD